MIVCNAKHDENSAGKLRYNLRQAKLTNKQAALLLGITERSITRYLSGKNKIPYLVQFAVQQLREETEQGYIRIENYIRD